MHEDPIADPTVGGMPVGLTERLLAFAARLRWLRARGAAASALASGALVVAVPTIVVLWLAPPWRWPALAIALGLAVVAAVVAAVRALRVGDASLLRGHGVQTAGSYGVVPDELATWLECHRRDMAAAPMASWLGRELDAQLPALSPTALSALARPRLGRWRRLVPVVLLLLLVWWLSSWLWPAWPGVLGGRATVETPTAGAGTGEGEGQGPATAGGAANTPNERDPEPGPDTERPKQPSSPPPTSLPPPEPPPTAADPVPEPPAPLLDLPEQQRFVVPEFIGDGPVRRARMHAAELEQGGIAPPPQPTRGGSGALPPPPLPSREQFERAAEVALQARHVPAEERPMVRRFFELLREAAK